VVYEGMDDYSIFSNFETVLIEEVPFMFINELAVWLLESLGII
jgi:hypothetical protein